MSDEILFGHVWTRPGLELPLRSLVTIAALMALGKDAQLRLHIRGGLRAGLTRDQITEATWSALLKFHPIKDTVKILGRESHDNQKTRMV